MLCQTRNVYGHVAGSGGRSMTNLGCPQVDGPPKFVHGPPMLRGFGPASACPVSAYPCCDVVLSAVAASTPLLSSARAELQSARDDLHTVAVAGATRLCASGGTSRYGCHLARDQWHKAGLPECGNFQQLCMHCHFASLYTTPLAGPARAHPGMQCCYQPGHPDGQPAGQQGCMHAGELHPADPQHTLGPSRRLWPCSQLYSLIMADGTTPLPSVLATKRQHPLHTVSKHRRDSHLCSDACWRRLSDCCSCGGSMGTNAHSICSSLPYHAGVAWRRWLLLHYNVQTCCMVCHHAALHAGGLLRWQ
jgi:hypothetical protein